MENIPMYQPLVHVNCRLDLIEDDREIRDTLFPSMRSPWADDTAYYSNPFVLSGNDTIWHGSPDMYR